MKCSGRSAVSGERIEIEFDAALKNVDPLLNIDDDDGCVRGLSLNSGFVSLMIEFLPRG